jgi:hypothetical protein
MAATPELLAAHAASIQRFRERLGQLRPGAPQTAQEARLALKEALRLHRQVLAAEESPGVRDLRRKQLRSLKLAHYQLLQFEAAATAERTLLN